MIREVSERSSSLVAAKVGAKFGKAGAKVIDDMDVLLAFYEFPAERWIQRQSSRTASSATVPG